MKSSNLLNACSVSGDSRVAQILKNAVKIPAFACRLDGFVNDTMTEYANTSVFRPPSVCKAKLVSEIRDVIRESGKYHFGFTMYMDAGHDEPVEMWIGHQMVGRARLADPDNRVHLFFAESKFAFKGGEPVRLVTGKTSGACRVEHLVLLKKRPTAPARGLTIGSARADFRRDTSGTRVYVTWVTSRPTRGRFVWGTKGGKQKVLRQTTPLSSHEVVIENPSVGDFQYRIESEDRTHKLTVHEEGTFRVRPIRRRGKSGEGRFTLPLVQTSGNRGLMKEDGRLRINPSSWPVSVGVPFAKGIVHETDHIGLLDSEDQPLPTQVGAQARWEDGSVKWALLHFESDGQSNYTVDYGESVRTDPKNRLVLRSTRSDVRVDTGPLRVRIPRDRTVLPGLVEVLQPDGSYSAVGGGSPAVVVQDTNGRPFLSGKPDAVVVEEDGPVKACIRIEVPHRGRGKRHLLRSTFRLHFFRGSGRVRVDHTFLNDHVDEPFTNIRSLHLNVAVNAGKQSVYEVDSSRSGKKMRVEQLEDDRFDLYAGRQRVAGGSHSEGSGSIVGSSCRVSVAVKDFWQNYPKGLAVDSQGIHLEICPELDSKRYPRGGELEDRLFYYLLDDRYKLKQGVSRTHTFWLSYGDDCPANHLSELVNHPPIYRIPLSVFNNSQAWTRLPSKDPSPNPAYESWVEAAGKVYAEDRRTSRAYGMLNFGDWFGERTYNWGNMEYDTPWCFLQEYVRGGDLSFFRWADEAARHLVDVDTCHASDDPSLVDSQLTHCVGHVGGYYPEGFRESAIFTGRTKVSHTWVEGLFLHAMLTGDRQILDSATRVSEKLAGEILNDYDFTNCRNSGWHLIHLSTAYRATGRRVFLNAAQIIIDRVLERQRPSGGWDRLMVPGHCHCDPPRHMGNAGFMVGVLMVGLKRFHEATGDRKVEKAIVNAADYCIERMWVPEARAFRYTCCPESSIGAGADMRILKGVAAAYSFTGEERFRKVLEEGVESGIVGTMPKVRRGVGKSICSPMRGVLQVIGWKGSEVVK